MRGDRAPARGERGSASVLVAVAATVLLAFGVAATAFAGALVAGARARTAADLAALAAADGLAGTGAGLSAVDAAVGPGAGGPCAAADRVARANAARLVACDTGTLAVTVVVEVRGPAAFGRAVRARARAEPGGWAGRTLNSGFPEPDS